MGDSESSIKAGIAVLEHSGQLLQVLRDARLSEGRDGSRVCRGLLLLWQGVARAEQG